MDVRDARPMSARQWLPAWRAVGVVLSVVANAVVAHAIFESDVGTVLLLDDSASGWSVIVPVAAGAVLACLQSVVFGIRISLVASAISVFSCLLGWLGFAGVTLIVMTAGSVLGWLLVAGFTRLRTNVF